MNSKTASYGKKAYTLLSLGVVLAFVAVILSNKIDILVPLALGIAHVICLISGFILAALAHFRAAKELDKTDIGKYSKISLILLIITFPLGMGLLFMMTSMKKDFGSLFLFPMFLELILLIAASVYWYKANNVIAQACGDERFSKGGKYIFYGTALVWFPLINVICLFAGYNNLIKAYTDIAAGKTKE